LKPTTNDYVTKEKKYRIKVVEFDHFLTQVCTIQIVNIRYCHLNKTKSYRNKSKIRTLSAFIFIYQALHSLTVRVWQGEHQVQKAKTIAGKDFTLLNLPFFLVHRIARESDNLPINAETFFWWNFVFFGFGG
jgi:hypothetical protein